MRLRWAVLFVCCLFVRAELVPSAVRKPGAGPYFRIHRGKLWGFMDEKGKTVIAPQFKEVGDFFAGRARVRKEQMYGYIDERGRVVIPYLFFRAGDFVEGLAPVQMGRRGWGVIDPAGSSLSNRSSGRSQNSAMVWRDSKIGTRLSAVKQGEPRHTVRRTQQSSSTSFMMAQTTIWGSSLVAAGNSGTWITMARSQSRRNSIWPNDFSDDRAVIRKLKNGYLTYGVIDKSGSIVVEPQFDRIAPFSEGLAAVDVTFQPVSTGVIDKSGQWVIAPKPWFGIGQFSEGVAPACPENQHCGFIDHTGKFVIQPRFANAQPFSEGVALVWSDDGPPPFYIDHSGNTVLKLGWTAWPFSGGLTVMSFEGRSAYVDHSGKIVAPYETGRR